jgi:hypothetical protein
VFVSGMQNQRFTWRSFLLLFLFGVTDSCSSPLDTFYCRLLRSFSFGVTAQAYVE